MGIKFHPKYCSYYAPLVKALQEIDGDVLELGAGISSTSFLHWMCLDQGRNLFSYENHDLYYRIAKKCESDTHKVFKVDRWEDIDIERPWGVVLIDLAPAIRRKEEARRLAPYAQCILLHDSQGRSRKHYHYEEIVPLFKYRYGYVKALPQTLVLSNFVDVAKWAR